MTYMKPVMIYFSSFLLVMVSVCSRVAEATPPWYPSFNVETKISFNEQPKLNSWTKAHLKAKALNSWPNNVKISFSSSAIIVKPENGILPTWKHIKKGDVYEANLRILPNCLGANDLGIDYGVNAAEYDIVFDTDSTLVYIEDLAHANKKWYVKKSYKMKPHPWGISITYYRGVTDISQYCQMPVLKGDSLFINSFGLITKVSPIPKKGQESNITFYKYALPEDSINPPMLAIIRSFHDDDSLRMFVEKSHTSTPYSRDDFKYIGNYKMTLLNSEQYTISFDKVPFNNKHSEIGGELIYFDRDGYTHKTVNIGLSFDDAGALTIINLDNNLYRIK